jgi:hypothetical protein
MTYDTDPTRWTHAPGAAPDVLRDAFAAGRNEGPSDLQMRALSLKLAALSGGVATAAQASAAQASTTSAGGAIGAAGTSAMPLGKLAMVVALLGTVAGGSVAYYSTKGAEHGRAPAPMVQPAAPVEAPVVTPIAPVVPRAAPAERAQPSIARTAPAVPELAAAEQVEQVEAREAAPEPNARATERAPSEREDRRDRRRARSERVSRAPLAAPVSSRDEGRAQQSATTARTVRSGATEAQTPEIELLRRARASLDARPRETYRLTQEHRETYPDGVFAQERDALAIEALQRSGEDKLARSHAESFIEKYPSSPHAHRFRESMGLR